MADKRAFAVLDVGYFENPKILNVLDAQRNASSNAVSMHVASILYCSQHLTDGFVSAKAMQRKIGGDEHDVEILVEAGLWHRTGHGCESCPEVPDGKVYVHDYLEHNRTSEGSKRTSKKAKEAANARWAKDKATPTPDAQRNASSNALSNASSNALSMPDAMHRQTDRQTVKKTASTAKPSKEFEEFWKSYPRKVGKGAAVKSHFKALKQASHEQIMAGVESLRISVAGKDPQFTPHPATWLNEIRWEDETPDPQPAQATDPDAVLGQDYWSCPDPPAGLSMDEELTWRREQRDSRRAERIEQAKQKLGAQHATAI